MKPDQTGTRNVVGSKIGPADENQLNCNWIANTWVAKPPRKRMNILRERFADENNEQGRIIFDVFDF